MRGIFVSVNSNPNKSPLKIKIISDCYNGKRRSWKKKKVIEGPTRIMDVVKEDGSVGVCYCKGCREQAEALKKTLATRIEKHPAKKAEMEAFFEAEKKRLEVEGMDLEREGERLSDRKFSIEFNSAAQNFYLKKFQEYAAVPGNPTRNIPPDELCPGNPKSNKKRKQVDDDSSD